MDPGVWSHGIKANPPGYLWSKYEYFLKSGWWDILHSSCLNVKLWSNSTNGTEVRTNERTHKRKDENYIPLGINAKTTCSIHCRLAHSICRLCKQQGSHPDVSQQTPHSLYDRAVSHLLCVPDDSTIAKSSSSHLKCTSIIWATSRENLSWGFPTS